MVRLAQAWGHIIIALAVIGVIGALIAIGACTSGVGVPVIVAAAGFAGVLHAANGGTGTTTTPPA